MACSAPSPSLPLPWEETFVGPGNIHAQSPHPLFRPWPGDWDLGIANSSGPSQPTGPMWSHSPIFPLGGRNVTSVHTPSQKGCCLGVMAEGIWSEPRHVAWHVPTQTSRCLMVPGRASWKEKSGWTFRLLPSTPRDLKVLNLNLAFQVFMKAYLPR